MRPTLDKLILLTFVPLLGRQLTIEVHVQLTVAEIAALQKAADHVRVHMAHEHSWEVRDTAMEAIRKLLAAAKETT